MSFSCWEVEDALAGRLSVRDSQAAGGAQLMLVGMSASRANELQQLLIGVIEGGHNFFKQRAALLILDSMRLSESRPDGSDRNHPAAHVVVQMPKKQVYHLQKLLEDRVEAGGDLAAQRTAIFILEDINAAVAAYREGALSVANFTPSVVKSPLVADPFQDGFTSSPSIATPRKV